MRTSSPYCILPFLFSDRANDVCDTSVEPSCPTCSPKPRPTVKPDKRLPLPTGTFPGLLWLSASWCHQFEITGAPRGEGTPGLLLDVWHDSHGGGALWVGRTCGHSGSATEPCSWQSTQLGVSVGVCAGTQAVGGGLRSHGLDVGEKPSALLLVTPLC